MNKLYLLLIFFLLSVSISAQISEQEAIQRRQQQETEERLRARDMEMRQRAISNTQLPSETAAPSAPAPREGCLDIKEVHISGVTKFGVKKMTRKVEKMMSTCVDKTMLQNVQSKIQKMYVDKGYVEARVYFDFKDIPSKKLNIIIAEGILEKIILLDPKSKKPLTDFSSSLKVWDAFPFMRGRVLNLRDVEQGLEQMNKLSSNNAVMEIRPGEKEGGSVVVINNDPLPKNTLTVSYDNSGAENTGFYRGTAAFSRDNILSLNENIYATGFSTLWNNRDLRYSEGATGTITLPFGYWTVINTFSYSRYKTVINGALVDMTSDGNSTGNTAALERMLVRGKSYKISLGAQLAVKDGKNYIEQSLIATSSRRLSVGSLYLAGTYYSPAGAFYSKLSANRGLSILGAKKDGDLKPGDPAAQFTSLSLYLNYSTNLGPFNYAASVDSQYGFDDMFGSEQMMLGSEGTVRGFKNTSAFGETGAVLRQDVKLPFSKILGTSKNEYINIFLKNLYAGAFVDAGRVLPKTYGDGATLAGAGGKIGFYSKYLNGGFTYARSITRPDNIKSEGNVFYFNIAANVLF